MNQRLALILRRLRSARPPTRRICFVISSARAGSTWLQEALNAHPAIFCGEGRLFGDYADQVPRADGTHQVRVTFDYTATLLAQHYTARALAMSHGDFRDAITAAHASALHRLTWQRTGKRILVDKVTPYRGTTRAVINTARRILPGASFVRLIRDGRDVATSGVFDWINRQNKAHPRHARFVRGESVPIHRFFEDADIEEWALHWSDAANGWPDAVPPALELRYEAMKTNFAGAVAPLLGHLGADASPTALTAMAEAGRFERMSGGRAAGEALPTAKARKGVVGDWRQYFTQRDARLFHQLAGDTLIRFGYEPDGAWVDAMPETLEQGFGEP